MTEDQKSIAERAEYHKGNLKDLTKDEIVHFLPAVLANKDAVIAELRAALAKSQPVEQGEPARPMSGEPVLGTKTWMEGGVVMTQNLTASDIYKPVPMTEDEFITAVEASGIEVDNVEAAFAIKRIVELFHGIKGATE